MSAARAAALHRLVVVTLLGFSSGLPLALTGQAMQAWLTMEGLDIATIGFLSLVGLPYTFKFLWAPLMDRFDLPWLGCDAGGSCSRSCCSLPCSRRWQRPHPLAPSERLRYSR